MKLTSSASKTVLVAFVNIIDRIIWAMYHQLVNWCQVPKERSLLARCWVIWRCHQLRFDGPAETRKWRAAPREGVEGEAGHHRNMKQQN